MSILQEFSFFKPAIDSDWSYGVLSGHYPRQVLTDFSAKWRSAPSASGRLVTTVDVLSPLVRRYYQYGVTAVDRAVALPVNALALGTMAAGASAGLAWDLGRTILKGGRSDGDKWSATSLGAATGYGLVRCVYTFVVFVGLYYCSFLGTIIDQPAQLLHLIVGRVRPQASRAADFSPLLVQDLEKQLRFLPGPGGISASFCNITINSSKEVNSLTLSGEIKAWWGLMSLGRFNGTVATDGYKVTNITLMQSDIDETKPLADFFPELLHGRMVMTGKSPVALIQLLRLGRQLEESDGYTRVSSAQARDENHSEAAGAPQGPVNSDFVRFFRGSNAGGTYQEISGTTEGVGTRAPTNFVRLPLAAFMEDLGLNLDH